MLKQRPSDAGLPTSQSPGFFIRDTHMHLLRVLRGFLKAHGISTAQWFLLRVLWTEDGLSQRELSERVGTTEPTTQSALRLMEKRGIVRQGRNAKDRRTKNIFLTKKGRALEGELIPYAREVNRLATLGLTDREVALFLELIARIRNNLFRLGPPGGEGGAAGVGKEIRGA